MRHKTLLVTALLATGILSLTVSSIAMADDDYEDRARVISVSPQTERINVPRQECRTEYVRESYNNQSSPAGAIIGGLAGGLLGNTVGRGNGRIAAAVVGAGVGAVVGDRIGNNSSNNGGTGVRSLAPGNGAGKRTGSVGTSYGTLGSGTASRTARNLISRYAFILTCTNIVILIIVKMIV